MHGIGAPTEAGAIRRGTPGASARRYAFALLIAAFALADAAGARIARLLRALGRAGALALVLGASGAALTGALLLEDHGEEREGAREAAPPVSAPSPAPGDPGLRAGNGEAPGWVAMRRPLPLYSLESPDTEGAEAALQVMTRGPDARRDSFTWAGKPDRTGAPRRPLVHLVLERHESGLPTFRPFFADLAMRAAEQELAIERMSSPSESASKFGGMEVADAILVSAAGAMPCLAFRRIDAFGFLFAGWYCGTAERPADRVSLACFIDRLDLVGGGQDKALKRHFAAAERARKPCPATRQAGRKALWLDRDAPLPPLKLSARAP